MCSAPWGGSSVTERAAQAHKALVNALLPLQDIGGPMH